MHATYWVSAGSLASPVAQMYPPVPMLLAYWANFIIFQPLIRASRRVLPNLYCIGPTPTGPRLFNACHILRLALGDWLAR